MSITLILFCKKTSVEASHQAGSKEKEELGSDSTSEQEKEPENEGTLIIDATCCPADVAYPTDLNLLNSARLWTERIIDHLYKVHGSLKSSKKKPRTYRKEARNKYHQFVKHTYIRKTKTMRRAVKEQLGYVKRNLSYIDQYLKENPELEKQLLPVEVRRLEIIREVWKQQNEMYVQKKHSVPNRIISLSQPWIRPIVRGKQKAKVEFGAKLSISVVDGYTFVDKLTFDSYNEGENAEFIEAVEKYKKRFGHYPKKVLADKIYGNRKNRQWCKEKGIYLSAEKLGRKPKNQTADKRQKAQDISERNVVECKFGNLKRRFGLDLIRSKLEATSKTEIYFGIFTLNMIKIARAS